MGPGRDSWSGLNVLNPFLRQPMQSFDQEKCSNHGKKTDGKVLAENSDGKEYFHDFTPGLLIQPLNLSFAEGTKKDFLGQLPENAHNDEAHVEEKYQADLGGG